ncbi:MAG: ASKHA domain-containing protein [Methanomassiliicoccales archaeon]|nr:ASKHA domain-containing protein [Methanomassiliicoccales archaeon]
MMYSVTFRPKSLTVKVEEGTTILDAAFSAGVLLNSVCGGKGTCRKCRVLTRGSFDSPRCHSLSEKDWESGYRLACETRVTGDGEVIIPEEAEIASHQILTSYFAGDIDDLTPLSTGRYLQLPPPTLTDNIGDMERIVRAMGFGARELKGSLRFLKSLPSILRDSDWKITAVMDEVSRPRVLIDARPGDSSSRNYGIALDIGTTTVVLSLIDLADGRDVAQTSDYNRQIAFGEDVLSRITYAEEGGLETLNNVIIDTVNHMISQAIDESEKSIGPGNKVLRNEITSMSVAGNTTMMHLFLRLDPRNIRYEPYISTVNVPPIFRAKDIGVDIHPDAPVYIVPGRASYVGGDITAGVIASGMNKRSELSLLIDVGTNGEIVLGNSDWMVSCSCSAGPAFEGGEVAAGMRAMTGAIERVRILDRYDVKYSTIGDVRPRGICGSGLIDLLAEMFLRGIVDRKGRIQELSTPRIRKGEQCLEFVVAWAGETASGTDGARDIVVSDDDIANIIRTKGAVYSACKVLLRNLNLGFQDVQKIYIAGGFGNYIDTERAIVIGLLPDLPFERFFFIGNGALAGARLALLSAEKRAEARAVYDSMTYFELSATQAFFDEFSSSLFLPHTDIEQFPTVQELLRD